jgi:hypothetical protein
MIKLTTKEDIALHVEEASEMFEETGCVPDVDGKKVHAEKIVPRAYGPRWAGRRILVAGPGRLRGKDSQA